MTSTLAAATALQFLLTAHPELENLPGEWRIDAGNVIRRDMPVDAPGGERAVRLISTALELDLEVRHYGAPEAPRAVLAFEGRWGGADWACTSYVHGTGATAGVIA